MFTENNLPKNIDYLQLDIEPPINTFECLKKIPFDKYKFAVITYETEAYYAPEAIKNKSREIIEGNGYELIIGDVCNHGNDPFEDWYVHPDLVARKIINIMKNLRNSNYTPDKIFLNEN